MNLKSVLKPLLAVLLISGLTSIAQAQIEFPAPSPKVKIEQRVGLTDITLEYSRPGVKGRDIFGSLVPYGEIWRAGANASTKITFSQDVKVAGNKVPAGTYALYFIPNQNNWTGIIHKNTSHWGVGDYDETEDLVRFDVRPNYMEEEMGMETMIFYINEIRDNSCTLEFSWDNVWFSIPVELGTQEAVIAELEAAMAGPSGRTHYEAARFYKSIGDLEAALQHIHIAVNEKDYSRFWSERLHSEILAESGDYKSAIATAEKALTMAEEAGNSDYVRANKENITKWREMK